MLRTSGKTSRTTQESNTMNIAKPLSLKEVDRKAVIVDQMFHTLFLKGESIMKSKLRFIPVLLLLALTGFVIGCEDETTTAPDMGAGAKIRVIHASPDAPSVDVYAEGVATPLITGLAYGGTSAYLDLDAGTYNIQLRAAGADPGSAPAFETGNLSVPEGAKITALAVGLLGSAAADDKFRVLVLVEDFTDPGAGQAAVRIVHGSADAPTVAIDVGNDGAPEITDFARFGETGTAGVALPSDTELQIAIWAGNPLSRVTVFTTPQLPEGGELFVIATGLLSKLPREADGFSLLAVGPTGTIGFIKQNPVVFALHASPGAPAVDIYAGSSMLVQNLAFGELSEAVQVPPAAYTLDFKATGSTTTAASAGTPSLAAGERYLAVASGFLGGSPVFQLIPVGDGFTLGGTDPLVRVVHASPDAPAVDVGTVSMNVVTPVAGYVNIPFAAASASAGTALPVGTLDIGVAASGTTTPVATFTISTVTGLRAFAVAAGSIADPPAGGEGFRLVIVNTSVFPWIAAEVTPNS
jgi:hypothetical protein